MKSKICYSTGLEEKELFEIESIYIWKLKYIIFSEEMEEEIDVILNSSEIFQQVLGFLEAISDNSLETYEDMQYVINQIETREQIGMGEYIECCIENLHTINNQNEFKYPLNLKDLVDNKWQEKIAN